MRRSLCLLMFLGVLLLSSAVAWADGDIYVGGPWGTRITSLPYTISAPGSYYLGGDLSYAGNSNGITITSDHVTLDLMGFNLSGPGSGIGIYMDSKTNVEIRNGTIAGWNSGIVEYGAGKAHRIINVRVVSCNDGVYLNGNGHLIKGCEAMGATLRSFYIQGYGTISGCVAQNFSGAGIQIGSGGLPSGGIISGNVLIGNGSIGSIGVFSGQDLVSLPHALIIGNEVSNWKYGINFFAGSSVIGNTVNTSITGQTGIIGNNQPETVLDQNTVLGPGTHTSNINNAKTRNNAW